MTESAEKMLYLVGTAAQSIHPITHAAMAARILGWSTDRAQAALHECRDAGLAAFDPERGGWRVGRPELWP